MTLPDGSAGQALAAYRSEWAATQQAGLTADYQSTEMRQFASDKGLAYFVGILYDDRNQGYVVKGPLVLNPQVASASSSAVHLTDCIDATQWLRYRVSDGQLKDDVPGGHHHVAATVAQMNGSWKVTDITVEGVGTC